MEKCANLLPNMRAVSKTLRGVQAPTRRGRFSISRVERSDPLSCLVAEDRSVKSTLIKTISWVEHPDDETVYRDVWPGFTAPSSDRSQYRSAPAGDLCAVHAWTVL